MYSAQVILEELKKKLEHDARTQFGKISTYAHNILKQINKMQEIEGGYYGSNISQYYNKDESTSAN